VRLAWVLRPVLAAAASLAAAGLALEVAGHSPAEALGAMLRGSLGSGAAWTATLLKTAPLLLTGLAVALCFRAGVWNIGAEGQLYAGALAATAVATRALPDAPAPLLLPAAVLAAGAAGAAFAALAGVLRAARGVSEVISTILLNFVAIQLVALAVHGPLQEAAGAYPQSDALPAAARLPSLGRLHVGVAAGVLLAGGAAWLLFASALGFRLRAVGGLSPVARFVWFSSARLGIAALALAGACAGLAGAFEVMGVTGRLYEGLSPGYGYTAIAVALLARLNPLAVVPAALFFGALEAGSAAMQREAGIPSVVTQLVQGAVILFSVGFAAPGVLRAGGRGPGAIAAARRAGA
jgi:general nucleoside transport system permease protein